MGRIEIEYEIMYDAFFKYQTKPKMTKIGDLYYEGKEFDNRPDNLIPGVISGQSFSDTIPSLSPIPLFSAWNIPP